MSMHSIKEQLLTLFRKSKKDRHRFLANHLSANIAAQIFSLRTAEERNWTQTQLAKEAGIAQPRIPVYESPDYGTFSLTTLKKLAHAFDVALLVKFVSFDELAREIAYQSSENLAVSNFETTLAPHQSRATTQAGNTTGSGPDFIANTSDGWLIVGESKGQQLPQDQLTSGTERGREGIYAAAGVFKQVSRALPENKLDQERQLVST